MTTGTRIGKKKHRNDLLLFAALLAAALLALALYTFCRSDGKTVVVRVDGEVVATYFLSEEITFEIFSEEENSRRNILIVRDGEAYMSEANCPDLICVHHKPISKEGDTIVCLPNRVTVTVE